MRQPELRIIRRCRCSMAALFLVSSSVVAAYHELPGDNTGVLHIHGVLTESACRLDMMSAWQDVALGDVGTGQLKKAGDRGTPVAVQLKLLDCLRDDALQHDERTGNVTRSAEQPVVSATFIAPEDTDNPQLVRVRGVSGLALRLSDDRHNDIYPGSRGRPLLLTPGQNSLTYYITPERTRAPLQPGAYLARVDFRLNYD